MNKCNQILKWLAIIIGILSLSVLGTYIILCVICSELRQKLFEQLSSNIGDFMTGTVGVFLTLASTLLLALTFSFQRKQFEESHNDAYRTRFEGTFFNILSMLYNVRTEMNRQIEESTKRRCLDIGDFYYEMKHYYEIYLEQNEDFAHSMRLFRKDEITGTEYKTAILDLGSFYNKYVRKQGCNIGFYFRFIHNLVSFVIEHWKSAPQDIHKYLNFIQAQLADEELALIFYDSISNLGLDKQKKYTFKENLDKNSFLENIPSEVLLAREHYKVFPNTRFRFLNADEMKKIFKPSSTKF